MDPSLDVLSDQWLVQLQDLEKDTLQKCNKSNQVLTDAKEQIDHLKQEMKKLSKSLDKIGCSFFGVSNDKNGLEPVEGILIQSKNDLSNMNSDLEKLKEKKSEDLGRLAEANSRFDSLKGQLNQIEIEMNGMKDSKDNDSYRVLSQLMQTKFQLNKQLCCVSLILDDEQRVKGTIKVDKENQSEQELRENIWSKYYRLY